MHNKNSHTAYRKVTKDYKETVREAKPVTAMVERLIGRQQLHLDLCAGKRRNPRTQELQQGERGKS